MIFNSTLVETNYNKTDAKKKHQSVEVSEGRAEITIVTGREKPKGEGGERRSQKY